MHSVRLNGAWHDRTSGALSLWLVTLRMKALKNAKEVREAAHPPDFGARRKSQYLLD